MITNPAESLCYLDYNKSENQSQQANKNSVDTTSQKDRHGRSYLMAEGIRAKGKFESIMNFYLDALADKLGEYGSATKVTSVDQEQGRQILRNNVRACLSKSGNRKP
jgi:hypothetical protein